MTALSAGEARRRVHAGEEIAFIDVREAGEFADGHPLFAIPLPYSRLEPEIARLVPRMETPVLLIDGGDGVAQRAAARLAAMGYCEIAWIDGGLAGWREAGFPVYQGVNVPSKALGELAEAAWHPATMTPDEYAERMAKGSPPRLFDVRPASEYARMRIPGASWAPNGEIAHRIDALMENGGSIVVNCAGRTRGIIGAIGLALAGYAGPIHAFENGTQGWVLSGRELERGNHATPLPSLTRAQKQASRDRARRLMERFSIPQLDAREAVARLSEPDRSTFVFDLRTDREAAGQPVDGAQRAEGVQLVQATDRYVGVRHARIILCCDTGLRSAIAAFWLAQLGFESAVVSLDDTAWSSARVANPILAPADRVPRIAARQVASGGDDLLLVDVRPAMAFRREHVACALWSIRPRLERILPKAGGRPIAFIGDGDVTASLCATDARRAGYGEVFVVEGGHAALREQGMALSSSADEPSDDEAIDFVSFVHDRHDGNLEASRRYLEWETGLVAQLDEAERSEFRLLVV